MENKMLNAEDALGLQEDLAIIRASQVRANVPPVESSSSASAAMGAIAVAMGENQNTMAKLKANLDKTTSNRNDVAAIARSARETIVELTQEIARLKGIDPDIIQQQANLAMTRRYDGYIDELMQRGALLGDPRQDPETMEIRNWYTPAM